MLSRFRSKVQWTFFIWQTERKRERQNNHFYHNQNIFDFINKINTQICIFWLMLKTSRWSLQIALSYKLIMDGLLIATMHHFWSFIHKSFQEISFVALTCGFSDKIHTKLPYPWKWPQSHEAVKFHRMDPTVQITTGCLPRSRISFPIA